MRRASSYTTILRRALLGVAAVSSFAFMVSCGDDPTTPTPTPSPSPTPTPPPGKQVSEVVKWMDERLQKEYMWMDEYNNKHSGFDRTLEWDEYLGATLLSMTTNMDDGGGTGADRYIYSNIQHVGSSRAATRASFPTVTGYGIEPCYYVVGVSNIEGYTKDDYGFVVEHTYAGSAAAEAGLRRGDVLLKVDGKTITKSSYSDIFYSLFYEPSGSVTITARTFNDEAKEYEYKDFDLAPSSYEANPVAYSGVLDVDKQKYNVGDKKIGYLSYMAFDGDFDDALVEAMQSLAEEGVTDMILDLRINGGGHVNSSILLASMLLDESYVHPDKIYARLKHNPNNKVYSDQDISLEKNYRPSGQTTLKDLPNIGIKKLYLICSEHTASASEMVIVGLRGLDVEVTLIGNTTEGKNCGMEVTEKSFDGETYEFSPITFMNENGKGFSDYGEGIVPEVNLAALAENSSVSQKLQSKCAYFPIPLTTWDDVKNDIALEEAVMQICGSSLFGSSASAESSTRASVEMLPQPMKQHKLVQRDVKKRGMYIRVDEPVEAK